MGAELDYRSKGMEFYGFLTSGDEVTVVAVEVVGVAERVLEDQRMA